MAIAAQSEIRSQITTLVRDFVRREVEPIAQRYDNEDIYPQELIEPMREMGLFGITIPEEFGGLGLDYTTFAVIFEELSRGWMSVSGIIGTHHVSGPHRGELRHQRPKGAHSTQVGKRRTPRRPGAH